MHAPEPPANCQDLAGDLESVLDELQPDERDVLILRYLEDRRLTEVGLELGISEQAAQKRVARALDSLRGIFSKRGITVSSTALATTLASQAMAALPATFISSVASAAVGLASTAITTTTLSTAMNLMNVKTSAAILTAAVLTGTTTYYVKEREADRLRADLDSRSATEKQLTGARNESVAALQLKDQQIEQLQRSVGDLPRLRGEVDRLNRELAQLTKLRTENASLQKQLAANTRPSSGAESTPDEPPPDLSEYVPRGRWRNAGLATPDDTIMTLQWAAMNKDAEAVLAASTYPPETMEKMREHLTGSGWMGEDVRAEAVRIVGRIPTGTKMLVQLEEQMADGTTLRRPVTLIQEPDGWKATVTDLGMGVPIGQAIDLPRPGQ